MGGGTQDAAMAKCHLLRSGAKGVARVKGVARGGHLTTFAILVWSWKILKFFCPLRELFFHNTKFKLHSPPLGSIL